ncbi:MAG TPA: hypothetical protein VGL39_22045 [Jatrophihabitantaceae bacterium]
MIRRLVAVFAVAGLAACSSGGAETVDAPTGSTGMSGSGSATAIPVRLAGSLQNPCWSPSGHQLALTRFRDGYNDGPSDLAVTPLDGTPARIVTTSAADNVNLPGSCWDRAGRIVYSTDGAAGDEIWTTSASGNPARLAAVGRSAWEPSFSPDGQWVVFESHNQAGTDGGTLWKVRRDGTGLVQLTRGADDREPNWSPRGDRIVFQSMRSGNWDVWTIDPSGGQLRRVTTGPSEHTDPSWSPDGQRIVYSSDGGGRDLADLFVVTPGAAPAEVHAVPDTAYAGAPAWSPDGRRIAFETGTGDPDGSAGTHIAVVPAPR